MSISGLFDPENLNRRNVNIYAHDLNSINLNSTNLNVSNVDVKDIKVVNIVATDIKTATITSNTYNGFVIDSGAYLPGYSITPGTSTINQPFNSVYSRIGQIVNVSGKVRVLLPTSGNTCNLSFNLPAGISSPNNTLSCVCVGGIANLGANTVVNYDFSCAGNAATINLTSANGLAFSGVQQACLVWYSINLIVN